jgi:MFS family permease
MTLFISPFLLVTMPLYARVTLSLDPQHLGYLMAASGVGSFSGSLGLLSIPHGHRAFATKIGAAMGVTAMVGLAAAPSFAWAAASIVLLTLGISTSFGIANIVIQERSPNAIRGRVSAVAGLAFFGLIPFSALLISWLTDRYGLRQTMGGCAAVYGLATAWLLAGRKRLATAPDPAPVRDPATV